MLFSNKNNLYFSLPVSIFLNSFSHIIVVRTSQKKNSGSIRNSCLVLINSNPFTASVSGMIVDLDLKKKKSFFPFLIHYKHFKARSWS